MKRRTEIWILFHVIIVEVAVVDGLVVRRAALNPSVAPQAAQDHEMSENEPADVARIFDGVRG
jgi:hypothetical protein